jgi:hypothetical protein
MMPMFAIEDLEKATGASGASGWYVRATDRYHAAQTALVRFDREGRMREYRVFLEGRSPDDARLLERWTFSNWQTRRHCDFPGRIEVDYFSPPPMGVKPPFRTARTRHVQYALATFSLSRPFAGEFSIETPPVGSWVQDDRQQPALVYRYTGRIHGTLDQLSDYFSHASGRPGPL